MLEKDWSPEKISAHLKVNDEPGVSPEWIYQHIWVSDGLEAQGFFAHPYHSWERGLNENTNGLIRQYLPKDKSFDGLTDHEVQNIKDKLNNRHRKYFAFRMPNQVFIKAKSHVALKS